MDKTLIQQSDEIVKPTTVTAKKDRSPGKQVNRPLTPKQAKFIEGIVKDKLSKTDAYIQAYNHNGLRKTAHEQASITASKPQVKLELERYTDRAKLAVLEVIDIGMEYGRQGGKEGSSYLATALQASNSVIDRVEGKAKQVTEVQSSAVTINIDLTASD